MAAFSAGPGGPLAAPATAATGVGRTLRQNGRILALIAAVGVAYSYSLWTLLGSLDLESPLAYVALVPFLALLFAWGRLWREPAPIPIHDRQLDYIVGLALIGVAAGILVLLPDETAEFWLQRLDLFSLPFFVAGLVALLFGVRRLWAVRLPIAFLFLAWPALYLPIVDAASRLFAEIAASIVVEITSYWPIATPAHGDATLFFVGRGAEAFAVSVGPACSGINGVIGYSLLAGVLSYLSEGPIRSRLSWLVTGAFVMLVLNVARIVLILVTGANFGQTAALGVLHPIAGLALFGLIVAVMLAAAPLFGLRRRAPGPRAGRALGGPLPVRDWSTALLVGAVAAAGLAVADVGLVRYSTVAAAVGDARITQLNALDPGIPGWQAAFVSSDPRARLDFGTGGTWDRFRYSAGPSATLRSSVPVSLDVVTADGPGALAAHDVVASYHLYGDQLDGSAAVSLARGVSGQVVNYRDPQLGGSWSAVWWEWPYTDGSQTRFERIVIYIADGPSATYAGAAAGPTVAPAFQQTDDFLVSVGRAIVADHLDRGTIQ